ncbi:MBL fold metallo-hydrolase, partial [Candidatus Aerophobetes bacterium]|nr:MBL fold metallo-hydrolase [Candidatus Aerophobetes bacterium]
FLSNTGKTTTLLFSGDIGRWNKPIINDPVLFEETDYLIIESTYGDTIHEDVADVKSLLKTAINYTTEKGGNLLIPSFAIERTQELLYYLNKLLAEDSIPHLLVFLDSPMAINVTEVFEKYKDYFDREMLEFILYKENPFYFSNLKLIKSVEESKAINHVKGSSVIIAGSGMCTGGRIKHHLANNIWRSECTVLFIGYQAKGTLGREIVEGAKQVRIHGKFYPVNAKIMKINGFSAHADREELRRWVSGFKSSPRKTFVVHGEEKPALSFAELLRKEKNWDVSVPFYGEEFILS